MITEYRIKQEDERNIKTGEVRQMFYIQRLFTKKRWFGDDIKCWDYLNYSYGGFEGIKFYRKLEYKTLKEARQWIKNMEQPRQNKVIK